MRITVNTETVGVLLIGVGVLGLIYEAGKASGKKEGLIKGYMGAHDEINSKAFVDHVIGACEKKEKPKDD